MQQIYQTSFDLSKLPESYVTSKFYEYGYKVKRHGNQYCSCCPICREGNSWGRKQRCWWIPSKNMIYCFNCGHGYSPYNWIKQVSGMGAKDILSELKHDEYDVIDLDVKERYELNIESREMEDLPENSINLMDSQQLEFYYGNSVVHKALDYIHARRLDSAVNAPDRLFLSLTDRIHKYRLIFPFNDQDGRVTFYQSRSFGANPDPSDVREKIRYLGKVGSKKTIFNYDRIDNHLDDVFVFEGPIDACFVRNGIAVAGVSQGKSLDLTEEQANQISNIELMHRIVWVLDSQWIDETSLEKTKTLLEQHEYVFIWPKEIGEKYKDFNEMAVNLSLDEIDYDLLQKNITNNLQDYLIIYNEIKNGKPKEDSPLDNLCNMDLTDFDS